MADDTPADIAPDAAAPETVDAPAAEAAPEVDPFDTDADQFPRTYVEKLRKESQSYRERAKSFESIFDGYDEQGQEFWKSVVAGFREDPTATAAALKEQLDELLAGGGGDEAAEPAAEDDRPLTRKELDQLLAEREQKAQIEAQVKAIESEAMGLGYNPKSSDYVELLWVAEHQTKGDIAKAHEAIQAKRQKIIDDFIAQKAAEGAGPPPQMGVAPSGERSITNLKDASNAFHEWLGAQ